MYKMYSAKAVNELKIIVYSLMSKKKRKQILNYDTLNTDTF